MKLIKPKQISGEIMTLFDEADKKVIIVSPYAQTKNWIKLQNTFEDLKKRNVPVEFYFRSGEKTTKKEIDNIGIKGIPVENLHCKFYMNEKEAIVSSMNLYEYSDANSLDIAYKTETNEEYNQLQNFYERYILNAQNKILSVNEIIEAVEDNVYEKIGRKSYGNYKKSEIVFQHKGNRYHFYFKSERFLLVGILSGNEYDLANSPYYFFDNHDLEYELDEGGNGYYSTIRVKLVLKSKSFKQFFDSDIDQLNKSIIRFLNEVDKIKSNAQ